MLRLQPTFRPFAAIAKISGSANGKGADLAAVDKVNANGSLCLASRTQIKLRPSYAALCFGTLLFRDWHA